MKKLINVCGTARCGSTMIDLILGNDERGFSLGEVHAWFRPFRTHHFRIKCSCGSTNCPWDNLEHLNEEEFYEKAFKILDVDFLVDSSKSIPWVVDNNINGGKKGIEVYNILLYKDPVSLFYSFWKRDVSIKKAREDMFKKYYRRFFQAKLPFISVNYNKFVADPQTALKELCSLIDIPYFEGKERFWEKEHHQIFGSMGTRKQVEKGNSTIKTKESFPQEYEKLIPKIEKENKKDIALQHVIKELRSHEMKADFDTNHFQNIKKPYWYYMLNLKQKFKQRFPEKWKYEQ